ncbi:MAG: potassium transporter Kup [Deltaproteobacteria bacterium]|nr:potassium transporter Kup [Deltaproteobacteria bacterium]
MSSTPPSPPQGPDAASSAGSTAGRSPAGHGRLGVLVLGSLGVVFGDIGTSPLYAIRECFSGSHSVPVSEGSVMGVVSLIFWALTLIVSVKYLVLILRADNKGEGGILSLMAMIAPPRGESPARHLHWFAIPVGIFGAALLYGDGLITPAISVMSAVEGLEIAAPGLGQYVVPISICILFGLFSVQKFGTGKVASVFGPIIVVWFATLFGLGVNAIGAAPQILGAVNPVHAVRFFLDYGHQAFVVLGFVFLAVTGCESIYADMGHFGKKPIRIGWYGLVFPALLANYFGQGALLLTDPEAARNPFYLLAPRWFLYPLIVLASTATVIASQALISGVFSITRQAVQLGYLPRLEIRHTSSEEIGQIYVPVVNWLLLAATILVVLEFRSSSSLAHAYGVAVTTTMVITTTLAFILMRHLWKWPAWAAIPVTVLFLSIDLAFFSTNIIKVHEGGWLPLLVGALVFTVMTTWRRGREILGERLRELHIPLEVLLRDIHDNSIPRVKGTAVYLTGSAAGVPHSLLHLLRYSRVVHERVVLLTVETLETPFANIREGIEVQELGEGFYRVLIRYGFMQSPNIPLILPLCKDHGLSLNPMDLTYVLGRETLIPSKRRGMAIWREKLFSLISRAARQSMAYFGLPPSRVIEVGVQIEM